MTKTEKNKVPMHPGAFKSCLVPYTDQIMNWWYDDKLPVAEIQRRLAGQGLEVNRTTVMRFIKVRERLAQKRKRPTALQPNTQHNSSSSNQTKASEAEELLKKLADSTPQQLWQEANKANKEKATKKV